MRNVIIVSADLFPAEESVRVNQRKPLQQRLHIHLGESSHYPGSLNTK